MAFRELRAPSLVSGVSQHGRTENVATGTRPGKDSSSRHARASVYSGTRRGYVASQTPNKRTSSRVTARWGNPWPQLS